MKKILLLLAILPMFMTSCSNDDESTEQTFFVNVYTKWEDSEEKVAKKAFLYIYEKRTKVSTTAKALSLLLMTD